MLIWSRLKITKETIEVELNVQTSRYESLHGMYPFGFLLANGFDLMATPPWPIVLFYTPKLELWRVFVMYLGKVPRYIVFGEAVLDILNMLLYPHFKYPFRPTYIL